MKTLIVDNETNIREGLKSLLNQYCPQIEIIDTASSYEEAKVSLRKEGIDLVFLDVELGDGTGIDLLKSFGRIEFQVIFITAHDKYAVDAFRCSALDFLLKPIDPQELINAVFKASRAIVSKAFPEQIKILEDRLNRMEKGPSKIVLSDSDSMYLVKTQEILWCSAEGSYTKFYLLDGSQILVSKNLKSYEDILIAEDFIRIHHSYLVNVQHIRRFERSEGGMLVMENGQILPVSVRKKDKLMQLLKNWNKTLIK